MSGSNQKSSSSSKLKWYIFTIIFLAVLLTASLVLGFSGILNDTINEYNPAHGLGEDVSIVVDSVGAQSVAINFTGKTLTQTDIPQKIKFASTSSTNNLILRAKIYYIDETKIPRNVDLILKDGWLANGDYYYYNSLINSTTNFELSDRLVITEKLKSQSDYSLIILVEIVDQNNLNLWTPLPENFLVI